MADEMSAGETAAPVTKARIPSALLPHEVKLPQPRHGPTEALAQVDLRLPPELALRLLHGRPAALYVHLEARQMLQLEVRGVAPTRLPDQLGDLRHRALVRRRDVEVLVLSRRARHCGDDAVGDVVHVRERARLRARAEDLQRLLAGQDL